MRAVPLPVALGTVVTVSPFLSCSVLFCFVFFWHCSHFSNMKPTSDIGSRKRGVVMLDWTLHLDAVALLLLPFSWLKTELGSFTRLSYPISLVTPAETEAGAKADTEEEAEEEAEAEAYLS